MSSLGKRKYQESERRQYIGPLMQNGAFKRPWVPRAPRYKPYAMAAALKSQSELKLIETAGTTYLADTAGTVTLLNGVATGTDYTNRIGRKAVMASVQVRGYVAAQDTTIQSNRADLYLIWDKQPNGALPTVADVLSAVSANAFINLNNRDRFLVLCHEKYFIGGAAGVTTGAVPLAPGGGIVEIYKKLNKETIYDGTSAGIADLQSGSLLMMTIGTGNVALSAGAIFDVAVRVRFTDP